MADTVFTAENGNARHGGGDTTGRALCCLGGTMSGRSPTWRHQNGRFSVGAKMAMATPRPTAQTTLRRAAMSAR